MISIEVLATVFAVIVLLKMVLLLVSPKILLNFSKALFKNTLVLTVIMFAFVLIFGYSLLKTLTIVQIAAVMLFTSVLYGLAFVPYHKDVIKLFESDLSDRNRLLKKFGLIIVISLVIALWTLKILYF